MREVKLPAELDLVQNHGKVDWAVRSIWDYYMTWFHFGSTTELYPVPASEVYADIAAVAGREGLLGLAQSYLMQGAAVKTLHVVEVLLASDPADGAALMLRQDALSMLLEAARNGLQNDYEIYWLQARLADTSTRLESASTAP
jgi:alkyl sulfatase BDS1-like metallo-beta-lactamase superfamily hydrolase